MGDQLSKFMMDFDAEGRSRVSHSESSLKATRKAIDRSGFGLAAEPAAVIRYWSRTVALACRKRPLRPIPPQAEPFSFLTPSKTHSIVIATRLFPIYTNLTTISLRIILKVVCLSPAYHEVLPPLFRPLRESGVKAHFELVKSWFTVVRSESNQTDTSSTCPGSLVSRIILHVALTTERSRPVEIPSI